MSSVIVNAVKELIDKVPTIEEVIREQKKAPSRPYADTAYVYNGFGDITLQFAGQYFYELPFGKVTKIGPLPEHKERNDFESRGSEVIYTTIPLKGESIAREIIETRGYAKKGMGVFINGTGIVPAELKKECDSTGDRFARTEVERFKVGREKAKAGTAGYAMVPSTRIYDWMRKFTPDDEIFAEQSKKTDVAAVTAHAIDRIGAVLELLLKQGVQPGTIVEAAQEAATAIEETAKLPDPLPEGYPLRRKPLETDAQLVVRQSEFMAKYNAGNPDQEEN